jgi:catechol-2,3-dioxygenase
LRHLKRFGSPEDTGIAFSIFFKDPDGIEVEITTYYGDKSQKNDEPQGFATCRRG